MLGKIIKYLFPGLISFLVQNGFSQSTPFDILIEPISISGLPGVQSYAVGQYDGKWLVVGGRLDGLHKAAGMGTTGAPFPPSSNNDQLIVVDPVNLQKWTASISSLPIDIREHISSTNTQFFQEGNYLYVFGGYGFKSAASTHKTFDKLTAIDVPNVINAVINGSSFTSFFRQITDAEFQITGGQLGKIKDVFYLVGGQNFDGSYSSMGMGGTFLQRYSNQIRKFTLNDSGNTISINHLPSVTDTLNLHRRDYNMAPQIMPDGKDGLTVFSGVFQYNADIPYLSCINIDSSAYSLNTSFSQYYNHYHCAKLPIYSAVNNEMHTVFFGGIAQYFDNNGVLTQDNNVPFVKTIARVTRASSGVMSEYKLPVEMPSLLGAGSEFIPREGLSYHSNGVLLLDDLTNDTTLVGYIYGGISSPAPNVFTSGMMGSNGTSASNTIFRVFLVNSSVTNTVHQMNLQSNGSLQLQVYPNPTSGFVHVGFNIDQHTSVLISVADLKGKIIREEKISHPSIGKNSITISTSDLGSDGNYFITVKTDHQISTQKIIIH